MAPSETLRWAVRGPSPPQGMESPDPRGGAPFLRVLDGWTWNGNIGKIVRKGGATGLGVLHAGNPFLMWCSLFSIFPALSRTPTLS